MTEEHKATFAQAFNIALNQCVRNGTSPEELWLGPDMVKEFREHTAEMFGDTLVSAGIEDGTTKYDGLEVRLMKSRGLRVGKSFSPDGG